MTTKHGKWRVAFEICSVKVDDVYCSRLETMMEFATFVTLQLFKCASLVARDLVPRFALIRRQMSISSFDTTPFESVIDTTIVFNYSSTSSTSASSNSTISRTGSTSTLHHQYRPGK